MDETLKEYLVKIGWDVNELGFRVADDKIKSFRSAIESAGLGMAAGFAKAGLAIFDTIYGITRSMFKLVGATAEADLETEVFARKMWTTEKNARSLTTALDSLGMSYSDLFYTTPEQYRRFLQLNTLGKSLEAPKELDETLTKIRDIQFEISKTKMIFQYATRWVVYYIGEYLGKDINELKQDLQDVNATLVKYLPVVTKGIAYFFSVVYKLGKAFLDVVVSIGKSAAWSFGEMETSGVKAIATLAVAFMALKSGPVGMFLLLLGAILLLLEDFMVWQKGGKSLFDWSAVQEKLEGFSGKGEHMRDVLGEITEKVGSLFDRFEAGKTIMTFVEAFVDALGIGLDVVNVALDGIAAALSLISGDWKGFKNNINNLSGSLGLTLGDTMTGASDFLSGLGLKGPDWLSRWWNNAADYYYSLDGGTVSKGYSGGTNQNGFASGAGGSRGDTTNTQNNNVTNNFYGTTGSSKDIADKVGDSVNRFRLWTPKT